MLFSVCNLYIVFMTYTYKLYIYCLYGSLKEKKAQSIIIDVSKTLIFFFNDCIHMILYNNLDNLSQFVKTIINKCIGVSKGMINQSALMKFLFLDIIHTFKQ